MPTRPRRFTIAAWGRRAEDTIAMKGGGGMALVAKIKTRGPFTGSDDSREKSRRWSGAIAAGRAATFQHGRLGGTDAGFRRFTSDWAKWARAMQALGHIDQQRYCHRPIPRQSTGRSADVGDGAAMRAQAGQPT